MPIETSVTVHIVEEISSAGVSATVLATEFNTATATMITSVDITWWQSVINWVLNLV